MDKIKQAAREPSTWAGIAAIAQAVASLVPAWALALQAISAAAGAVAVAKREGG